MDALVAALLKAEVAETGTAGSGSAGGSSAADGSSAGAAAPLASALEPVAVGEGLPAGVWQAAAQRKRDAQAVTAWLDGGGSVDAGCTERKGATLLMAAAMAGHEEMVRMLLQRGASVDLQDSLGTTALMYAASLGAYTIVQALLDAKADASMRNMRGMTALMMAEHKNYPATAQLLRQHGLEEAVRRRAEQRKHGSGGAGPSSSGGSSPTPPAPAPAAASSLPIAQQHAFCDLAKQRDFAKVKSMLEAEPRLVNVQPSQRWSALHQFAKAGHEEAVRYLLSLHADKDATTRDGQTALSLARDERVRHLLGGGLSERQKHAFLDLCRDGEFERVRQMVEAEPAYVNVQPAQRWTALHQAAGAGDKETVKLLLAKGADKAAKNRDGQTPLQVADKSVRTLLGGKRPAPDRSDDEESEEDSFIDDEEEDEDDEDDEDEEEYVDGDSD